MTQRVERAGLQVATVIADLLEKEICPGTGVEPAHFWSELAALLKDLGPRNEKLLAIRESMQKQIDDWHRTISFRRLQQPAAMETGSQRSSDTQSAFHAERIPRDCLGQDLPWWFS